MRILMLLVISAGLTFGTPAMYGTAKKAEAWNQYVHKNAPEPWSCDFDDILTWVKSLIWR
jgi:hypothetical protein